MLAELALANASFAVIKEAVANGGDIIAAGQHLFSYFDNKSKIQKKANEGGNKSDMEEFMALEQLKKQEEELKTMMIYQGRPGLWYDWLKFQSDARKKREEAERKEALRKLQLKEKILNIFWWSVLFIVLAVWIAAAIWAVIVFKVRN
jgi:hypothetical protein